MRVVHRAGAMQKLSAAARGRGERIGLVPTMGALHRGHASLLAAARRECDCVVASIFVNPLQFGLGGDLSRYPRTTRRDLALLGAEGCDLVFVPAVREMYPSGFQTQVEPGELAERFEGASRPGHFRGVTTVCLKLFEICRPHVVYFGQKDYQQALVVRQMVSDFDLDLEFRVRPTVRDPDGLALSSRNRFLSARARRKALALPHTLTKEAQALRKGRYGALAAQRRGRRALSEISGLRLDYFAVRRAEDLGSPAPGDRDLVLLAAVVVGRTRLIDNLRVRL